MPANESTESRPPRGAPSPLPSHPHPIQVTPAAQVRGGGGANLHMGRWVGKLEKDIGRPEPEGWYLSGGRTMGDGRWGGPDTGGGATEYTLWTERRQKGRKERGDGQDVLWARHPDESWRGGKGRNQTNLGRET